MVAQPRNLIGRRLSPPPFHRQHTIVSRDKAGFKTRPENMTIKGACALATCDHHLKKTGGKFPDFCLDVISNLSQTAAFRPTLLQFQTGLFQSFLQFNISWHFLHCLKKKKCTIKRNVIQNSKLSIKKRNDYYRMIGCRRRTFGKRRIDGHGRREFLGGSETITTTTGAGAGTGRRTGGTFTTMTGHMCGHDNLAGHVNRLGHDVCQTHFCSMACSILCKKMKIFDF